MYKQDFLNKANTSENFGEKKVFYVIALASVLIAMMFGLFAVTANPIIISLAVALVGGFFLVTKPIWMVWLLLTSGLLVVGMLPLYLDFLASKAAWGVSILGFILLFLAFFRIAIFPEAGKVTPAFVWFALFFLIYAIFNSLLQWHTAFEFLGGIKRYFQMYGLLFMLCWYDFDERDIDRWKIFLLIVAILQLPTAVYELLVFAPLLASTWGVAAVDLVAGTFGSQKDGGGANAEMCLFLIIMMAFLLARHKEKILSFNRLAVFLSILILPLFLGETKAVIVMLPLMFLVLYRHEIFTRFHYWLIGFISAILLVAAIGYYYLSLSPKPVEQQITEVIEYNFQNKGYGGQHLNRTTVLTFWAEKQGAHDPVSFMFGNGIGSSHTATRGHIAKHYPRYGIGLTAASTLLWDLGIVGLGLFIAILIFAWSCTRKLWKESNLPSVRADAVAIQAALVLFVFHIFYRDSLLDLPSIQIVFTGLLGYLAWVHRRHFYSVHEKRKPI
ncbi:hypothetical protein [Nitrosomonas sp.]|uniref:hypothetical protein n=1 Tax=Nitrosomonas sp. TaxID=42353 RepID=UPI001D590D31|nr:hypothetical protein [Nitrosomonas sp.]MBX3616246.1 hypothetical protein [Nitrosomonas sp.]